MNIAAPFSRTSEVEMLIQCGADELYCGIQTPEWRSHFGDLWWMNRRSPSRASLLSLSDLLTAVTTAHSAGIRVHVTLNAPYYPSGSTRYLIRLARLLSEEIQIDGIIVSDINLISELRHEDIPIRLHLSSLGGVINPFSAHFFKDLGIHRIILPRQLRPGEIRDLMVQAPDDMEFEVFAVNDGCLYDEGYCQTVHTLGPFCLHPWDIKDSRNPDDPDRRQEIREKKDSQDRYLWYLNNCGSSFQEDGFPNGPCSLCRFADFRDMGIRAVKVVGREASFYRKMRSLQLVKAVMDRVNSGGPPSEIACLARSLRRTPDYCADGRMCYYRNA